jgi:hypothetical protein
MEMGATIHRRRNWPDRCQGRFEGKRRTTQGQGIEPFTGADGVFLVTDFGEPGTDEFKQATAAVRAAKEAGVKHFIWSTLPDVDLSFKEIVDTLNRQGHEFSFKQVPTEVFASLFPMAAEIAAMFSYFQAHTYLGSDSHDRIALANKIAGRQPINFSAWARVNFPVKAT